MAANSKQVSGTEAAKAASSTKAARYPGGTKVSKTKKPAVAAGTRVAKGKALAEKAKAAEKPPKKKQSARPAGKKRVSAGADADQSTSGAAKLKQKLVRDSFTMPKQDFALFDKLKERMTASSRSTKKSELLRAGLHALSRLSDAALKAALDGLDALKAGRPRKSS